MAISITIIIIYVAVWAKVTSMYHREFKGRVNHSFMDALFVGAFWPALLIVAIIVAIIRAIINK